jgi:hypothetical protein
MRGSQRRGGLGLAGVGATVTVIWFAPFSPRRGITQSQSWQARCVWMGEQPDLQPSGLEVILHLRAMLVRQFLHRLEFDNNFIEADKIRFIFRPVREPRARSLTSPWT